MSEPTLVDAGKKAVNWSILVSLLMIVAGLWAIAQPYHAGLAMNIFIGWMLAIAGIGHLVFAWYTRRTGNLALKIVLGLLYLGVAFYLLEHPARGLKTLTIALAFYLVIEGVTEIVLFFQHRDAKGAIWFLMNGIITLVLGGMIYVTWPSNTEWALGTLVGISIFFSGVSRLMISLAAKRTIKLSS
jgi:uncharacterized membrane protein HdeD (DUF308 family)